MKTIHDLIQQLESRRYNDPISDEERCFNDGINTACNEIEEFFSMNEQLGEHLSVWTRKRCVAWLCDHGYIDKPENQLAWDREGIAITRYHLEEIVRCGKNARGIGKVGWSQIRAALNKPKP